MSRCRGILHYRRIPLIEAIKNCAKCALCTNQKPLLDKVCKGKVFWVGLSAKKIKYENESPLSSTTNSGKIISQVEERCAGISMYKTNIVKCLPLDDRGKLRYPNKFEINLCISNIDCEITALSPSIVFLLGSLVTEAVGRYFQIEFDSWIDFYYKPKQCKGIYFVPIQHPSYIHVYKRKSMYDYMCGLESIIRQYVENDMEAMKS